MNSFNDKQNKTPLSSPALDSSTYDLVPKTKLVRLKETEANDGADSPEVVDSVNNSASIPLSSESVCESAKIEFLIPKSVNREAKTCDASITVEKTINGSVNTPANNDKAVETVYKSENIVHTHIPAKVFENEVIEKQPVIMTLDEIKEKLLESETKNYRRLFLPGRGWVSSKKLQEEVLALQASSNIIAGSTKLSLKGEVVKDSEAGSLGSKMNSSSTIILGVATSAQIAAAALYALNNASVVNDSEAVTVPSIVVTAPNTVS